MDAGCLKHCLAKIETKWVGLGKFWSESVENTFADLLLGLEDYDGERAVNKFIWDSDGVNMDPAQLARIYYHLQGDHEPSRPEPIENDWPANRRLFQEGYEVRMAIIEPEAQARLERAIASGNQKAINLENFLSERRKEMRHFFDAKFKQWEQEDAARDPFAEEVYAE